MARFRSCPSCHGQGKLTIEVGCPECEGRGSIEARQVVARLGDLMSEPFLDELAAILARMEAEDSAR